MKIKFLLKTNRKRKKRIQERKEWNIGQYFRMDEVLVSMLQYILHSVLVVYVLVPHSTWPRLSRNCATPTAASGEWFLGVKTRECSNFLNWVIAKETQNKPTDTDSEWGTGACTSKPRRDHVTSTAMNSAQSQEGYKMAHLCGMGVPWGLPNLKGQGNSAGPDSSIASLIQFPAWCRSGASGRRPLWSQKPQHRG